MALLFLGKASGRQEQPGQSTADGAGGGVQGWEEQEGIAWARGAGGCRGQGRIGPAGTAEHEGAAERCLSEHEAQIHTLCWLGMLPPCSSPPLGPRPRRRSRGGSVPALLSGGGAAGVKHYLCPHWVYSQAAPLQRCLESLEVGSLLLLCQAPDLQHPSCFCSHASAGQMCFLVQDHGCPGRNGALRLPVCHSKAAPTCTLLWACPLGYETASQLCQLCPYSCVHQHPYPHIQLRMLPCQP